MYDVVLVATPLPNPLPEREPNPELAEAAPPQGRENSLAVPCSRKRLLLCSDGKLLPKSNVLSRPGVGDARRASFACEFLPHFKGLREARLPSEL